jgi:hypothetical protein
MDEKTGPTGAAETARRIAADVAVELERAEALEVAADAVAEGPLDLPELGYYEAELRSLRRALRSEGGPA